MLMVFKSIWKCEPVTVGLWEHMEVLKLFLVVETKIFMQMNIIHNSTIQEVKMDKIMET